jgi:hypothetical protein
MTQYVLTSKTVERCLHRLIQEPIHRMFPGYLCLQQQAASEGRRTQLTFPYNEFFDDYLRVREDSDRPYYVPFTQAQNPSLEELWYNSNVSGTYAPSSLRSTAPLMQIAEIEEAGHNSKWGIAKHHWELARHNLCDGGQVPIESLAAYLFRDYAIEADSPSVYTLIETFNEEFGYEFGGGAFSHLYRTGDSEIGTDSFTTYD